jgi:hypothetical protein
MTILRLLGIVFVFVALVCFFTMDDSRLTMALVAIGMIFTLADQWRRRGDA